MSQQINDLRRITLRIPPKLHQAITLAARDRAVSLNHLAVEALEQYLLRELDRFPLRELSDLLAPSAQAKSLSEETLQYHVQEARKRIWRERYQQMIENL